MIVTAKIGEPITIELMHRTSHIIYRGEPLVRAENAPITKENAVKQLTKFGSSSFSIANLKVEWDEGGYAAVSKLNEIRRIAIQMLEEKLLEKPSRDYPGYKAPVVRGSDNKRSWSVLVKTLEQLEACLAYDALESIYWEWQYNNELSMMAYELCQQYNKSFYLALPYIMKSNSYKKFSDALLYWETTKIQGYLIRNYGCFYFLNHTSKHMNIDYTLNIMNNESIHFWNELGADSLTLSMEVNEAEHQTLKGNLEKIVYGYIPVMTSQQCLLKHHNKCSKNDTCKKVFALEDRKEMIWQIETDCEACMMQIMPGQPMALKVLNDARYNHINMLRLNFSHESTKDVESILGAYLKGDIAAIKKISSVSYKSIE